MDSAETRTNACRMVGVGLAISSIELDELAQKRLIVLLVLSALAGAWLLQRRLQRRQEEHFAALARAFGTEPLRSGELNSHFSVTIGAHAAEVRHQHRGGGAGSQSSGALYVVTAVPLAGVSDLHSAEIRVRQKAVRALDPHSPELDDHVTIRDFGFPLRDGWLNARAREALVDFYRVDFPLDSLHIEEGRLIHRSMAPIRRFEAGTLRELLTRQAALAAVLERAL